MINESKPLQERLNEKPVEKPKIDPRATQQKIDGVDDTYYIMKTKGQSYAIPKKHYPPKTGDFAGSLTSTGTIAGPIDEHGNYFFFFKLPGSSLRYIFMSPASWVQEGYQL